MEKDLMLLLLIGSIAWTAIVFFVIKFSQGADDPSEDYGGWPTPPVHFNCRSMPEPNFCDHNNEEYVDVSKDYKPLMVATLERLKYYVSPDHICYNCVDDTEDCAECKKTKSIIAKYDKS